MLLNANTMLQNYLKIGQMLLEKNIFKIFTLAIYGKTALPSGSHDFQFINTAFRNLIRGITQDTFLQNHLENGQIFSHYSNIMQNRKPPHPPAIFLTQSTWLEGI